MKKSLPIILAGVVFLGLAAGGWFFVRGRSGEEVTDNEGSDVLLEGETEKISASGKLEDLLNLGKAVKCTWQNIENNTGVAFIKDDKIYTEATANGVKSYYISRDNCSWMWQEGQAQGYKICVEPEEGDEETKNEVPEAFSMNTGTMNYNCVPQVINDTRFEVPANVEFVDFAQMVQMNLPAGMGN